MHRGYLAWLDILGFKEFCRKNRSEKVFGVLCRCADKSTEDVFHRSAVAVWHFHSNLVKCHVFQDTVVLYSVPHKRDALPEMLSTCCSLLYSLISQKIPVRGAIAYGNIEQREVCLDNHLIGSLIMGSAALKAYEFEQKQDWIGVALCPSLLEHNRVLVQSCKRCREAEIPCKDKLPYDGYALIPAKRESEADGELAQDIGESISSLKVMEVKARPEIKQKYSQTIGWLESVEKDLSA